MEDVAIADASVLLMASLVGVHGFNRAEVKHVYVRGADLWGSLSQLETS